MARRRNWTERLSGGKAPHVVTLDKAFAGVPAGKRLFIASPELVAGYLDSTKRGDRASVTAMRQAFAAEHGADATCPVTSGIFLRIVAEAALEKVAAGTAPAAVTPFWRMIDSKHPLTEKLSCGPYFVRTMRESEGLPW